VVHCDCVSYRFSVNNKVYGRWPLRHADFLDKNRQMSQKRSISASEMYSRLCVEWVADHFDLRLT